MICARTRGAACVSVRGDDVACQVAHGRVVGETADLGVGEQSGEIAPTEEAGPKLAKMAQVHQRSGKFKITTANDGTPQRKVRDYFKGYLNELLRKQ